MTLIIKLIKGLLLFLAGSSLFYLIRKKAKDSLPEFPVPVPETGSGILWILMFCIHGWKTETVLYGFLFTVLLWISFLDLKTYEIPDSLNLLILAAGIIRVLLSPGQRGLYLAGFFAASFPLYLLFRLSGGEAVGGGDVKLMAVCGLVTGWRSILWALFSGCLFGVLMRSILLTGKKDKKLFAMAPCFSAGIFLSLL